MQTIDNVWHPKQCTAGKASSPSRHLISPSRPLVSLLCLRAEARAPVFLLPNISPLSLLSPLTPSFPLPSYPVHPHSPQPQSIGRLDSYTLKCNIKNCRDRKLFMVAANHCARGSRCLSSAVYLFLELYFTL